MNGTRILIATFLISASFHSLPAEARRKHSISSAAKTAIEDATTKAPDDNETCFAPDEPCAIKLRKFIESANTSIDVAIYDVNEDQVVHALLVQSKKVSVRVLVDRRQSKGNHSAVALLLKAGVKVRCGYQSGIMHNKFAIVDGKRLETGSFNYTNHASRSNQENQVYLSTPAVVGRFKARFQKMWDEASDRV